MAKKVRKFRLPTKSQMRHTPLHDIKSGVQALMTEWLEARGLNEEYADGVADAVMQNVENFIEEKLAPIHSLANGMANFEAA
jgi:hypothetical protein